MIPPSQKLNPKVFGEAEMRKLGAFQSRSAAARGVVAEIFSRKLSVTLSIKNL
jgi:hypothetical protein